MKRFYGTKVISMVMCNVLGKFRFNIFRILGSCSTRETVFRHFHNSVK